MSSRSAALAVTALALGSAAVAIAAVRPAPDTSFFYVKHGSFSISLDTTKTSKRIAAGAVNPQHNQRPQSGALAVCPSGTPSGPVSEIHVGFPGAPIRLVKHRYRFSRSYTQKRARIVVLGPGGATTTTTAKVHVTGVVAGRKLITGTIAIAAPGCSLGSSKYRATVFTPQSG